MSYLVADAPFTYCLVRREFLRDQRDGHGVYEEGCIIGVTALEGRAPMFQVMLRSGALFHRLPLHALVAGPCEPRPLADLCMWDAFGYHLSVHVYRYLKPLAVDLRQGERWERGAYLFTIDWAESSYSEMADQHKATHVIALDSGHLVAMPNNRLRWHEPSWIQPFTAKPDYLVQSRYYSAEGDRALVDGVPMYYEVKSPEAGTSNSIRPAEPPEPDPQP